MPSRFLPIARLRVVVELYGTNSISIIKPLYVVWFCVVVAWACTLAISCVSLDIGTNSFDISSFLI